MKKKLLRIFTRLLFRVTINGSYQGGKQNGHEKTLVIANHTSFLDGFFLYLFLPDNPVFVANSTMSKNPLFKLFLRQVDYLPLDPSNPMAMKKVVELINTGRTIVIFPEGRITITGSLMKIYAGAAFAATKTQATIIPVQITGARHTYFSRLKGVFNQLIFPKITLTIFSPTKITENPNLSSAQQKEYSKEQMHQLMMKMVVESAPSINLYQFLLSSKKLFGKNKTLFQDGISKDLTFSAIVKKIKALSYLLKPKLINQKRIGLLLPNSNTAVSIFYALQHMGKTPAMINYTAGTKAIKASIKAADIKTVITSRAFIEKGELTPIIEQINHCHIIYLEDLKSAISNKDKFNIFIKQYLFDLPAKVNPNDEAVILFTSGSEGLPKGVVHNHQSILTNASQIEGIYDFNPLDKFMICLPMFHVFGLAGAAILPVKCGASSFLYPNPLHYRVIPEIIYDNSCTVLLSTSTFLKGYASTADCYDFNPLRYVIAGAEKLSEDVSQIYLEKFGIKIFEGYGATETAPVIAANTTMQNKQNSVGKIVPAMDIELIPVTGINKPNTGQLIVHSNNVMLGYLKSDNPGIVELSPINKDNKRSYDTGDIVHIDEQGFVFIQGRVKRFAKMAGEMVSLDSVENLAIKTSPKHQHAVINIPDKNKGEALVLYTTNRELERKALLEQAKTEGIAELAVPKKIIYLETIPLFTSGKTNYVELKELSNI